VAQAMQLHTQVLERMRKFQDTHEFVLCAVNQLPPFEAAIDWPKEIAGVAMEHYIAWQKTCYWISATLTPAISVPAGFTPEGSSGYKSSDGSARTRTSSSSRTRSSRRHGRRGDML
jgi:amidase